MCSFLAPVFRLKQFRTISLTAVPLPLCRGWDVRRCILPQGSGSPERSGWRCIPILAGLRVEAKQNDTRIVGPLGKYAFSRVPEVTDRIMVANTSDDADTETKLWIWCRQMSDMHAGPCVSRRHYGNRYRKEPYCIPGPAARFRALAARECCRQRA